MGKLMEKPSKIFIAKPLAELSKVPCVKKIDHYIYDFHGVESTVWEMLLGHHAECKGYIDGDTIVFCCYSCTMMNCYWRKEKDRLKKEGYVYRDAETV